LQPAREITFLRKLDLPEASEAHRGYLLKRTRLMLGGDYLTSDKERGKKKKGKIEKMSKCLLKDLFNCI